MKRASQRKRPATTLHEAITLARWITLGLFPALLVLAAAFLAIHPITDPDFWYHAAFGREVLRSGAIPRQDIFSSTAPGHPWISSGWAAAVFLHELYTTSGAMGPVLFVFVTVAAAALVSYFIAWRKCNTPASATLFLLVAMLASYARFNPRPDICSQVLLGPLVLLLASTEEAAREKPARMQRRLWLLPVLFLLWANLHALFFLGLAVVALYALWRFSLWRQTQNSVHAWSLIPCALCFLTWLANPYGWRLLQFVYDNASLPKVGERVYELKPLINAETLHGGLPLHLALAIVLLLALTVICYWKSRTLIPGWRTAALALFVFLLFYQRRQIGLAGATIPALLIPNLTWLETRLARRRFVAPACAAAMAFAICGMRTAGILELSRGLPRAGVDCAWFPCGAAKFLKENPAPPHLFHDLYTGGYLLHELGPEQKVFIDGRLEIYKDGPWQDYFAPPEKRMTADQLFTKYGVQTAVLDIRGARNHHGHLANQLTARADWRPVYFDDQYCTLVHETSATKAYVDAHGFRFVNPLDWNKLGAAAADPVQQKRAQSEAQRALSLAPESAAANTAMALVNYQAGDRSAGDKYLKAAQAIDPTIELGVR